MGRSLLVALFLPLLFLASSCAGVIYTPGPPGPVGTAGPSGPAWGPGPDASVEVSFFYGDLSPYGHWFQVSPYGWVWAPHGTAADWRPYTVGRWVYTSYGWTWVSEWRWGWAPFHYGRWVWHPPQGWIWVPGDVWAPAWVTWRYGPGWVGWAPLPPGVSWRAGVGLSLGNVDLDVAVGSGGWVFVPERSFLDRRPLRQAVPVSRNREIFRQTRDVTRYEARDGHVLDRGVPVEQVERNLRQAVPRYRVEDLGAPTRPSTRVKKDRVRVYRPEPTRKPAAQEPPGRQPRKAVPRKPPAP